MDSTPGDAPRDSGRTPPARTPSRRLDAAETPTSRRGLVHTPLDRTATRDLRNSVRRGNTPGRRAAIGNAPTPHTTAARRALDQRRSTVFTPGKNRRRSLMEQRETPMGLLRDLGRVLAPQSKPVAVSSASSSGASGSSSGRRKSATAPPLDEGDGEDTVQRRSGFYDDDLSDDLPIERPRLSLPIDNPDDSSDEELRPPRLSGVEQENYTVQSIELPRRQDPTARLSRGSFGDMPVSDFLGDDVEPTEADIRRQSDFFPGLLEDLQNQAPEQLDYERIDPDPTVQSNFGRESEVGLNMPLGLEDQTTFVLSEPAGDGAPTSPLVEQSFADATGADAATEPALEPFDDVSDRDFGRGGPDFFDGASSNAGSDIDAQPDAEATLTNVTAAMLPDRLDQRTVGLRPPKKKQKRVSRHGIEYPALPSTFVKRVAQTALQSSGLSNSRISADTLDALTQASDWFFEQLGDDLGAYANHAKRKTIEESDVATLMRRQRQVSSSSTMFSLAQRHLPRELLQELRMPVPQPVKRRRAKRRADDGGEDLTEVT